jgi:phosphatidylserine/phosphatidylglycerophosphate/cardiolipin synthase-like enzyme
MGSMNFTPEAATVQANVVHTFASPQLAGHYADRHGLLAGDLPTADIAKHAGWLEAKDVPGTKVRVFFSPEPGKERVSIDTVVDAVKHAKSSVLFCMFSPTDPPLLRAMLDMSDKGKIVYGLRNTIPDPDKVKASKDPAARQVTVDVWNRSRKDHKTVSYDLFRPGTEPRDFLPELSTVDTSTYSLSPPGGKVPAVHVHHKFVLIDADTDHPTIYTGSANMSQNSTNNSDENLLEIKGNVALARTYLAEFMRLYNHYHARAVWEQTHGKKAKKPTGTASAGDPMVLRRTRDAWVKGAYKQGTTEYAARTRLAGG